MGGAGAGVVVADHVAIVGPDVSELADEVILLCAAVHDLK